MVSVHPYKARLSTIDGAAKQLTHLASTGSNWSYTLGAAQWRCPSCASPYRGHLTVIMVEITSNIPYGEIHQLEVCQLLGSGSQVVYPEGLNGCQVPVITTLPEMLSNGMTMLKGESTFLQVDLSQSATKEQESKALSLGSGLSPTLPQALPGPFLLKWKANQYVMEVSKLLSQQFWILLV